MTIILNFLFVSGRVGQGANVSAGVGAVVVGSGGAGGSSGGVVGGRKTEGGGGEVSSPSVSPVARASPPAASAASALSASAAAQDKPPASERERLRQREQERRRREAVSQPLNLISWNIITADNHSTQCTIYIFIMGNIRLRTLKHLKTFRPMQSMGVAGRS